MTPDVAEAIQTVSSILTQRPRLAAVVVVAILALGVWHVGVRRSLALAAVPLRRGGRRVLASRPATAFLAAFVVGLVAQLRLDVIARLSEVLPL